MEGGYFNDTENKQQQYQSEQREPGRIISCTCHMLDMATLSKDETIDYKGIELKDIIVVGYIIEYKQSDAKTSIKIWDQTGSIVVNFFHKNETNSTGLSSLSYTGERIPVRIFATIKTYKKEKSYIGASIKRISDNEVFVHFTYAMQEYLFLSGKSSKAKEQNIQGVNEFARNIANNNNYQSDNVRMNDNFEQEDPVLSLIYDYRSKYGDRITRNQLSNILSKKVRRDQIENAIINLLNQGNIFEQEENTFVIQ